MSTADRDRWRCLADGRRTVQTTPPVDNGAGLPPLRRANGHRAGGAGRGGGRPRGAGVGAAEARWVNCHNDTKEMRMSAATPGAGTARKLMTADEFWEFVHRPENLDRDFDLIRGEVVEVSRPRTPHGIICSRLVFRLQEYAERRGQGYVTCGDTGVVLAEDSVVGPDVAYFTDANKFEDVHPKWGDVAPVVAVEVSSPNDRPGRVNAKIREYLAHGVKIVWQ